MTSDMKARLMQEEILNPKILQENFFSFFNEFCLGSTYWNEWPSTRFHNNSSHRATDGLTDGQTLLQECISQVCVPRHGDLVRFDGARVCDCVLVFFVIPRHRGTAISLISEAALCGSLCVRAFACATVFHDS